MKFLIRFIVLSIFFASMANPVAAQTLEDYHPFLSDKFNLGIGLFWPKIDFNIQVDGTAPEDDIDFDEVLNISDYQTAPTLAFRWRFGEKWSLFGQYWSTSSDGTNVLTEDVSWEDVVFKEGTFISGGLDLDIGRVFVGRKFDLAPQHELGVGFGLHWMNLDSFLEGEILINEGGTDFHRAEASAAFPLPNIGAWYMYSWSPKWLFQANIDWLSASIGDYSGSLWDASVGFNYQAFKNVGFGLHYAGFVLDVDVDKDDWHGQVDYNQSGPMLSMTATW